MKIIVKEGTGKAICRLCGYPIKRTQLQISITSYNASAQIHRDMQDCLEYEFEGENDEN